MKKVPFVANSSDDLHCVPAVFRMLNQYFFGEDLSWEEIDKIMGIVPGKGSWTYPGLTYFAKKGLRIVHVENIDYQKLFDVGPEYLRENFGEKNTDYYINKSNLPQILNLIPEYLKNINQITRESSVEEVLEYLKKEI